jgi:hypothetical protein
MKKIVLLLALMIGFIGVYSQTVNINKEGVSVDLGINKDSVLIAQVDSGYVTNTNIEKLIDKYGGKVSAAMVAIAKELKQPVEHIYVVLVRQQVVKSIADLFLFLVTIVLSYISIKAMINPKALWNWNTINGAGNIYSTGGAILAVISVIILGVSISNFNEMVTGFVNPEFGAMQDIVGFFK